MAPTTTPDSADDDDAAAFDDYGDVPFDVLWDFLLRLPANHLARLRAVCRKWRSIISDPGFVAAHASVHPGPLIAAGVVVGGGGEDGVSMVDVRIMDLSGNVMRCVPGLPCLRRMMRSHGDVACVAGGDSCIRAVDLGTGAVSVFPDNHLHEENGPRRHVDLRECSPARCAVALVLGQTASGEHKALRIRHHIYHQLVEVFTLADGRWSEAPGPPNTIRTDRQHRAVVNGVAYFLVDPILDVHAADSMASFDLATEQWSPTLLRGPLSSEAVTNRRSPPWHGRLRDVTLGVLDGRLMVVHHNDEDLTLDLWFRLDSSAAADDDDDDDGEARWCRRYAIRYHAVFQMFYEDEVEPLCVLDDDRGRVVLWVWRHGRRDAVLRVYDPTCDATVDVVEIANCVDVAVCTRGTCRWVAHQEALLKQLINLSSY